MARNWVVRKFYPVHSFLKPAAFDCGPLHTSDIATSAAILATDLHNSPYKKTNGAKLLEKLSVELPKEQTAQDKDESSPLHRHGNFQSSVDWPRQTSITVIG